MCRSIACFVVSPRALGLRVFSMPHAAQTMSRIICIISALLQIFGSLLSDSLRLASWHISSSQSLWSPPPSSLSWKIRCSTAVFVPNLRRSRVKSKIPYFHFIIYIFMLVWFIPTIEQIPVVGGWFSFWACTSAARMCGWWALTCKIDGKHNSVKGTLQPSAIAMWQCEHICTASNGWSGCRRWICRTTLITRKKCHDGSFYAPARLYVGTMSECKDIYLFVDGTDLISVDRINNGNTHTHTTGMSAEAKTRINLPNMNGAMRTFERTYYRHTIYSFSMSICLLLPYFGALYVQPKMVLLAGGQNVGGCHIRGLMRTWRTSGMETRVVRRTARQLNVSIIPSDTHTHTYKVRAL